MPYTYIVLHGPTLPLLRHTVTSRYADRYDSDIRIWHLFVNDSVLKRLARALQ